MSFIIDCLAEERDQREEATREALYESSGSVAKIGTEGIIGELNFLWLEPDGIFRSV